MHLSEHVLRVDNNRIRLILQSHFLQVTTLPLSPFKPQTDELSVTCCQKPQPYESVSVGGWGVKLWFTWTQRKEDICGMDHHWPSVASLRSQPPRPLIWEKCERVESIGPKTKAPLPSQRQNIKIKHVRFLLIYRYRLHPGNSLIKNVKF